MIVVFVLAAAAAALTLVGMIIAAVMKVVGKQKICDSPPSLATKIDRDVSGCCLLVGWNTIYVSETTTSLIRL
jgi:hypothetical protein